MMLQLMVELTQSPSENCPHPLLVKSLASLVWKFPASPITTLQDADRTRCVLEPARAPICYAWGGV